MQTTEKGLSVVPLRLYFKGGRVKTEIAVVRGKKQTFTLPVELIGEGKRPNFEVRPGDVVFVPERLF